MVDVEGNGPGPGDRLVVQVVPVLRGINLGGQEA